MFQTFGFCGSRNLSGNDPTRCSILAAAVQSYGSVMVGCASGADRAVRASVPNARVFNVVKNSPRWAYAARSAKMVSSLAVSPYPVLVGFPGAVCPEGLVPSPAKTKCFAGFGSGSWASLAYAVGLDVPIRVFLPATVVPPPTWGKWSFIHSGLFAGSWQIKK